MTPYATILFYSFGGIGKDDEPRIWVLASKWCESSGSEQETKACDLVARKGSLAWPSGALSTLLAAAVPTPSE